MRYSRRVPPFLLFVIALGLLFAAAALLLLKLYRSPFHAPQADVARSGVIALYLVILGLACAAVVSAFNIRALFPGRRRIPLDSWHSQARALALAAVGPLGGLIVTLANAPSFIATGAFLAIFLVAVCWPVIIGVLLAWG